MPDTVSSQILFDDKHKHIVKLLNASDGSGESAITKVDVSALAHPCDKVRLMNVWYTVSGMIAQLLWDADTDVPILNLQGDGHFCFEEFGGLPNNAGTGVTGDVKLTTVGASSGDSYSLILGFRKH